MLSGVLRQSNVEHIAYAWNFMYSVSQGQQRLRVWTVHGMLYQSKHCSSYGLLCLLKQQLNLEFPVTVAELLQ